MPSIQILVSRYHSPTKGSRDPWESLELVKSKVTLQIFLVRKQETVIKDKWDTSKGHRSQLKGVPWDKFGTIWSLKRIMTILKKTFN